MDLLSNVFVVIFYVLFFLWGYIKIRNIILINKLNCKKQYKLINKDNKNTVIAKRLLKIIISSGILLYIYIVIAVIIVIVCFFMFFITLGGTAYIDTGTDPTFYNNLIQFSVIYFKFFKYIFYVFYIIIFMILIRALHINVLNHKLLENNKGIDSN